MSLCRSIYRITEQAAAGRAVDVVHLRVGRLRQVVPETLRYCWGLVVAEGSLAGSRLEIEHVPIELSCRDCAARTGVAHELILVCGACGGARCDVVAGEEFLLTSLELRDPPPTADAMPDAMPDAGAPTDLPDSTSPSTSISSEGSDAHG